MNIPEFNNEPVIQFNAQQIDAIEKAVAWYKRLQDGKTTKRVFFIAGYAGTGKTSIAREIVRRCVGEYGAIYIAPTGKAASRLKQKGCRGAKTLHQFIYNVRGVNDDNEPIFARKSTLDERPHLVVLDEASMVGEWDTERLLDHRIPVLALGDIGQVPPVKAAAYFTEDAVDVLAFVGNLPQDEVLRLDPVHPFRHLLNGVFFHLASGGVDNDGASGLRKGKAAGVFVGGDHPVGLAVIIQLKGIVGDALHPLA